MPKMHPSDMPLLATKCFGNANSKNAISMFSYITANKTKRNQTFATQAMS